MTSKDDLTLVEPTRPLGAVEIPQFHLAGASTEPYVAQVYGCATIQFGDRKRGLDESRRVAFLAAIPPVLKTLEWDTGTPTPALPEDLIAMPPDGATYRPLPASAIVPPPTSMVCCTEAAARARSRRAFVSACSRAKRRRSVISTGRPAACWSSPAATRRAKRDTSWSGSWVVWRDWFIA